MKLIDLPLWRLVQRKLRPKGKNRPSDQLVRESSKVVSQQRRKDRPARASMRDRYTALVTEMKCTYGIRVRKWRTSMSGCAWEVHYDSGHLVRLIESPYPKGPMSCAIFLHEVGHHAIGFNVYRPRCLEEYHAWQWALQTMRERGLNVTQSVERRFEESMRYAIAKAQRRGLKRIPRQLEPFARAAKPEA